MNANGFEVGDVVTWRSQAGGSWTEKTGAVVEVVPALCRMSSAIAKELGYYGNEYTPRRKGLSYVVRVGDKFYWPRTAALRLGGLDVCGTCHGSGRVAKETP